MAKSKFHGKKEVAKAEVAVEKVEKKEEVKPKLTYLGPGPLSGEYRFAEIAGSISARSEEEAKQKAEEIATKHPSLLRA